MLVGLFWVSSKIVWKCVKFFKISVYCIAKLWCSGLIIKTEGKFNNRVVQIANSLNYKKMYSCIPGFYYNEVFHMVKGRSLVQFANKTEFDSILKGGDHLLSFWYKYKYYKKWEYV